METTSSLINFTFTYNDGNLYEDGKDVVKVGQYLAVFKSSPDTQPGGYYFFVVANTENTEGNRAITYDGKTAYGNVWSTFGTYLNPINEAYVNWSNWDKAAWTMVFGNITGDGETVSIPVKYKNLEASFNIIVL